MTSKTASRAPTFSIALLCWNHAPYLDQCIRSLTDQTEKNFEIIFLDNVSTDGSFQTAADTFEKYGLQATLLRNDVPQGIAHNLNRLLSASKGDLVCTLSTDDWLDREYVATMVALGTAHPDAGWFSCGGWQFFQQEQLRVPIPEAEFDTDRPVTEVILGGGEPLFFIGCAYRRSSLEAVGGWDERMPIEDRDLFLRLSLRFAHRRNVRRLVHYRRSATTASANAAFMIDGWERFYAKHASLFGPRLTSRRAETYRSYAALLTDQGLYRKALAAIVPALRLRPLAPLNWRTLAYLSRRAAGL